MFTSKPLRPYERKYDVVIVDEVDNMFIDQGASPAQLSEPCDLIHYKDILNIIYYNKDEEIGNIQNKMDLLFNLCALKIQEH